MNILTGDNIRKADLVTMEREPVTSYDLMERASQKLAEEIFGEIGNGHRKTGIMVFCGKGNNAGDGLAVARLLAESFSHTGDSVPEITVVPFFPQEEMTPECRKNSERLPSTVKVAGPADIGSPGADKLIIVDAVLGTGVKGTVRGPASDAIRLINKLKSHSGSAEVKVISIDLPSGLPAEPVPISGQDPVIVKADKTLTIEFPKLSLLYPSTGRFGGRTKVIPIGLDREFVGSNGCGAEWIDPEMIRKIMPGRNAFDHKGCFGHVLIVAGSTGMTGAAVLATGAALKSGCGLVTVHIPSSERHVMHISHPSAIVSTDPEPFFSVLPEDMTKYTAIGAGPGLGQRPETASALKRLMEAGLPMVLDADALNIIASHPEMYGLVPEGSVLTPHIGELRRLLQAFRPHKAAGEPFHSNADPWRDEQDKTEKVKKLASRLRSVIVVKGAHTMVCTPSGNLKFCMTGNPGMAKGGSGDVLTGLVAGLLSRGLSAENAAVLGVHFHGIAGDRASVSSGEESMNASDILAALNISHNSYICNRSPNTGTIEK